MEIRKKYIHFLKGILVVFILLYLTPQFLEWVPFNSFFGIILVFLYLLFSLGVIGYGIFKDLIVAKSKGTSEIEHGNLHHLRNKLEKGSISFKQFKVEEEKILTTIRSKNVEKETPSFFDRLSRKELDYLDVFSLAMFTLIFVMLLVRLFKVEIASLPHRSLFLWTVVLQLFFSGVYSFLFMKRYYKNYIALISFLLSAIIGIKVMLYYEQISGFVYSSYDVVWLKMFRSLGFYLGMIIFCNLYYGIYKLLDSIVKNLTLYPLKEVKTDEK